MPAPKLSQPALTKALAAVKAAGLDVVGVTVDPSGRFEIATRNLDDAPARGDGVPKWGSEPGMT